MFSFERENKNINNPLSFIYTGCAPCPELSFHCRTWKNITADKTIIKKKKKFHQVVLKKITSFMPWWHSFRKKQLSFSSEP